PGRLRRLRWRPRRWTGCRWPRRRAQGGRSRRWRTPGRWSWRGSGWRGRAAARRPGGPAGGRPDCAWWVAPPGRDGAPGARGGGRIRGTPAPSGPPVILSRNGKSFTSEGETNVRAGTTYKVTTERDNLNINVKELDAGSWVMFELPGFTKASAGTEVSSLDALRKASATAYYKGDGSLWLKVVSTGDILGSGP